MIFFAILTGVFSFLPVVGTMFIWGGRRSAIEVGGSISFSPPDEGTTRSGCRMTPATCSRSSTRSPTR